MNNNDYLLYRVNYPYQSYGIIKYNNIRRNKNKKYLCFIEGSTDEIFYKNLKDFNFINDIDNFIYNTRSEQYKGTKGKENVIKQFKYIKDNNKDDLENCIFIVDHDFDELLCSNEYVNPKDKKSFSITKPYAFENYFLTNENIEKIFDYFKIAKKECYKFEILLDNFIKEIEEYIRLKSTTKAVCNTGSKYKCNIGPSRIYKSEEIFIFNFNDNELYDKEKYDLEVDSMKKAIKSNSLALQYYYCESMRFANDRNFFRGHDAYRLLEKYLMFISPKYDISPKSKNTNYIEIIKNLKVDMDFKNGVGDLLS